MSATASPSPSRDPLPGAAVAAGIGLAGGLALPLASGLVPALLVGVSALGLARWRARATPDPAALAGLPRAHRWALAALLLAPMIPLATLAARTIASLVVVAPGALWIAGPALVAALVLPRVLGTWSYVPVLGVLVLGTAGAAAWGARFEAAAPHARGETWGGPILGIHPFQSTAIAIDGYGPFDLPINDYVEPDGSKGYGPGPLAEALQRDLKKIAEQQFAERGPARAYQAFAGATVTAEVLPAARERLDRPADQPTEPRLHVTSGGLGRRSRVEFLCPGAPNDPRPRQPDGVMERMCPDKYAAEASAGLGLTGRWTGYAEALGQPRASLGRALGWPRDRLRDELRLGAWIVLALLVPVGWAASGRAAAGLARWGGGVALAAAVLAVLLLAPGFSGQVEAWSRAAAWESPWRVAPWIALLALGSGHAALAGGPARGGWWARALPLAAGTLGLAGSLAAGAWLAPDLGPAIAEGLDAGARMLPAERLIAGLGEALAGRAGIGLDTAEALVAGAVIAALVGLLAALLGPGVRAAGIVLGPARPIRAARLALLAVVVPAALLVLSRKTAGTAALLAPAAALAWLGGAALALAAGGSRRALRVADLLASLALVGAAGAEALARDNDVMRLAVGVLGLVSVAALVLLRRPPRAG